MPRVLQLRWSDEGEDTWRTVREVPERVPDNVIIGIAERHEQLSSAQYAHDFHAIFRVVEVE
jgi:hypothetical protein